MPHLVLRTTDSVWMPACLGHIKRRTALVFIIWNEFFLHFSAVDRHFRHFVCCLFPLISKNYSHPSTYTSAPSRRTRDFCWLRAVSDLFCGLFPTRTCSGIQMLQRQPLDRAYICELNSHRFQLHCYAID